MSHSPLHDRAELDRVANKLRAQLQEETCCPVAAAQVATVVLATFVLDMNSHDPLAAAAELDEMGKRAAQMVRDGRISLRRAAPERDH